MEINWRQDNADLYIGLKGSLNSLHAMDLDDKLSNMPKEIVNIYFDFEGLDYITSAGLRILYWSKEYAENKGGRATIKNVSEEVLEVLERTGFTECISIE